MRTTTVDGDGGCAGAGAVAKECPSTAAAPAALIAAGRGLRSVPAALPAGLRLLDLSGNPLASLRNLEMAPALQQLVLDGCGLGDAALAALPLLPRLDTLSLNKNQLCDAEALLRRLRDAAPALAFLALLGNPCCPHALSDPDADDADYERFRCYALSWLPALAFLDSRAVTAAERERARARGRLMRVARPGAAARGDQEEPALWTPSPDASPLPVGGRAPGDHRAAYGRCRYRYSGKHSEGNRFIGNNDL
ncbi:hypothetical protein R5R35_007539 [Gryllus longicercus]|uniref:Uncharacterized protein n=1 Tax=Gryllus longicercus TaxID=2509291 RepID=A0AAN9VZV2_9ORTH